MPRLQISKLFDENCEELQLSWILEPVIESPILDSDEINNSDQGLIGHLNLVHPNWVQIFSHTEANYLAKMTKQARQKSIEKIKNSKIACLIMSDGEKCPAFLKKLASEKKIPIMESPIPSLQIVWVIRAYLGRALAESVIRHGVLLDVLGVGIMITGDSGVGKSELALELISRGSGLVADDVVQLDHIAPHTLEGHSPPLLKDFLEVRGLGMLNIKTIFGETAVRRRKNLKLIVVLTKNENTGVERLPMNASNEEILGVPIRVVKLPVAAGRNLAVLVEAAVRNYVLQLRGINSTEEFINRQKNYIKHGSDKEN